ncbi:LOW QUALITY PROTEIN: hypothetical protein Cgig2_021436 [Carnegiea gigantea]|uniref:Uncharacterized protein n=1 Tax=Carnegiea gigantea TaxID=171969 RepID=A0A9Q1K3Z8_9CARY|nr:LOW QUALITY PROTEIN: hypothetical protein Cgig2_021436 [Carnegiea gigantea]
MTDLEVPSEVEFSMARFWDKAYNVPGKKQIVSFARVLAPNIDVFVSCSKATMFRVDKALCFRVDIDILKPLRLVVYIKRIKFYIKFKYVKLSDFYYRCGKLGLTLANYGLTLANYDLVLAEEGDDNLSRHHNAGTKLLEEKKLFMAFKNQVSHPKACVKLVYDNLAFVDKSGLTGESGDMIMANVIEISPETMPHGDSQAYKGGSSHSKIGRHDNLSVT